MHDGNPRRGLAVLLALVAAACGRGGGTPEQALHDLRAALQAGDAVRVLELHDPDSRAHYAQRVRTMRARVAAGDPASDVLPSEPDARSVYLDGSLEEAAGRWVLRHGQAAEMLERIGEHDVVATEIHDEPAGGTSAVVRVRSRDGSQAALHFVKVRDGEAWTFDAYRHFQESLDE